MLDWIPTLENDPCVPEWCPHSGTSLLVCGSTYYQRDATALLLTHDCMHAVLLQSRPTLCDSMGCSLPGSSVHGILQVRTLEWVTMPCSRGSSRLRGRTHVSRLLHRQAGSLFQVPPGKPITTWVWLNWQAKPSGNFIELGNTSYQLKHKSEGREKLLDKECSWDYPGSSVVKTPHPQWKGPRFDPWWGN